MLKYALYVKTPHGKMVVKISKKKPILESLYQEMMSRFTAELAENKGGRLSFVSSDGLKTTDSLFISEYIKEVV